MSLLARIAESQGAAKANKQSEQVDAEVAATKPDAGQVAAEGRNAYSQAIAEGADEELEDEAAGPEEQKKFTEIERAMAEKIYGQAASNEIVKAIQVGGDVVKNVGTLANQMMETMVEEYGELEDELHMALIETAVEQMVDLAESADDTIQLNDDQMAEAFSIAITDYTKAHPDAVDNEAMNGFSAGAAPAQTGGRPNAEVTNENQGEQPKPDQAAVAGAAEIENTSPPIARI
jgi:hypothetical protein|tara:strand:+ start:533 stop:1231 length:699 start_codon:yes stop_codon:yes gene_type:complete